MSEATSPLKRPLRYRLEALFARAVFASLSVLPVGAVSALGGWLGRMIGPLTSAHRTAAANLQRALPEMNADQRKKTLKSAWDNFGRTMTEYAAIQRLQGTSIEL
ncbi:MAG: lauroyl acyltransferase, partial [Rhodospirillaceae bacterium]